jgi:hypothetical protein
MWEEFIHVAAALHNKPHDENSDTLAIQRVWDA